MKNLKLVFTYIFGLFMILGGIVHFLKPEFYFPFIPEFLPQSAVNYLAGALEIAVGIGTFVPSYCSLATLGIFWMMILFLPLHILDVFKEQPVIGSHTAALIRLPIQFVLIYWAWYINKSNGISNKGFLIC